MPELPDLEYIQKGLSRGLVGRTIEAVTIKQPIVIRNLLNQNAPAASRSIDDSLIGLTFDSVHRHGPFLHFVFMGGASRPGVDLIVHPMLAGRFYLQSTNGPSSKQAGGKTKGAGLCLSLQFEDCTLSYLDTKKMGKIYAIPPGETKHIPRYDDQGLAVVGDAFSADAFLQLLERRKRQQVRVFLMDQANLSAIGNAYADEILFAAGIHPKTIGSQLTPDDRLNLYDAICRTLEQGIAAVAKANQSIDVKVRDHMQVRNRRDEPCNVCGTTIRRVAVLGYDAFFCPTCQPARRDLFIDWRKS